MISIRIYNSGSLTINNIRPEHIEEHIEYNKTFRFGCALVVDGEIKNEGYLEKDRILSIVDSIDLSKYKHYSELPYR